MLKQETYIFGISAFIFMVCAFGGLLYLYFAIYNAGELLTTRITAIQLDSAKEKMVKDLEISLSKTEQERTAIGEFVLTEEETSVFLTDIEKVAASKNVLLTTNSLEVLKPVKKLATGTSTPATPVEVSFFDTLNLNFSIEGQEENVTQMLQVFETLPYHSNVTSFSLDRKQEGNAKGTLSLSVSLLK